MDVRLLIDLIGWIGAAALLTAYASVSGGRIRGDSTVYQVLNLLGGACLAANTIYYGAYPAALVNLVWITIAVLTLTRTHVRK